jgi:cytochrome c biogenesis protein CcmG/thiol:disulfide interchange protein DsbE
MIILGCGLAFGLIMGLAIIRGGEKPVSSGAEKEAGSPITGSSAPNFELLSISGEKVQLTQFLGKPVIVNFWASWCIPCKNEMPILEDMFEKRTPGIILLGINYEEPRELVRNFISELKISFPVLLDPDGKVSDQYYLRGYPTTYFIDSEGVLRAIHVGELKEADISNYLSMMGVK